MLFRSHYQTNSIDRPNASGPAFPWERLYKDLANFDRKEQGPRLLEGQELPLLIIDGRSYAPVRTVIEAVGYTVIWDQSTETAYTRR